MTYALIVDDDASAREVLCQVAGLLGWTSSVASNGAEALRLAHNAKPDIILSDVNMPLLNGIELARLVRQDCRLRHIPLVLLSSSDNAPEAIDAGCTTFVTKPFDLDTLLGQLEQLVSAAPLHRAL